MTTQDNQGHRLQTATLLSVVKKWKIKMELRVGSSKKDLGIHDLFSGP